VLPPSDPSYFVISTVPEDKSNTVIGYLSSNGSTVYDPFEHEDTVYALTANGSLLSYISNNGDPKQLGIIGTKPGVPNTLLATISENEVAECAPIYLEWSIHEDDDGYDSLGWNNSQFPSSDVYFCVTNNGGIGGDLYAVFIEPPSSNCVNVTLELGG